MRSLLNGRRYLYFYFSISFDCMRLSHPHYRRISFPVVGLSCILNHIQQPCSQGRCIDMESCPLVIELCAISYLWFPLYSFFVHSPTPSWRCVLDIRWQKLMFDTLVCMHLQKISSWKSTMLFTAALTVTTTTNTTATITKKSVISIIMQAPLWVSCCIY